jgi:hypothetical protein
LADDTAGIGPGGPYFGSAFRAAAHRRLQCHLADCFGIGHIITLKKSSGKAMLLHFPTKLAEVVIDEGQFGETQLMPDGTFRTRRDYHGRREYRGSVR